MNSRVLYAAASCLILASLGACTDATTANDGAGTPSSQQITNAASQTTQKEPEPIPDAELTVLSGGDVLTHMPVVESARTSDGYDFTQQYAQIKEWIEGADLALCSLEVPILAPGQTPSGYPIFGAPTELAKSMKDVGYDGCSTANNHALDRGFSGIESTIDALTAQGLGFAGTAATAQQGNQIQMYELTAENGKHVKIAHIAATTVTNGFTVPADAPYSWNVVGEYGKPVSSVIDQARHARELGADIVIAHMHWGTEYQLSPNESDVAIAQELADSGQIDLIFGGHPHVVQPLKKLEGGPNNKGMWITFSMGNQLSNQSEPTVSAESAIGYMATAVITVPGEGDPYVSNLHWTLTTVDVGNHHTIVPATQAAQDPSVLVGTDVHTVQGRISSISSVTSQMGTELLTPPTPSHTGLTLTRE